MSAADVRLMTEATGQRIAQAVENLINPGESEVIAYPDSVRYGYAQTLTDAQKQQARDNIGLGNVNNTSDADKPVSTAMQTALDAKASVIVEEITTPASVMSFPDGAPVNARDLVVGIEPVQDLHGYDHPWPAGGGKNLFDEENWLNPFDPATTVTWNNNIATITTTNGRYGATGKKFQTFVANTTYVCSCHIKVITRDANWPPRFSIRDTNNQMVASARVAENTTETDLQFAYTPTSTIEGYVSFVITGDTAANAQVQVSNVQLEVGSAATSFEPYSNICPITGWTGANIHVSAATTGGTTYPISWQTEAGTVYGGTLDVTTGLLTVTDANIASYAGESLPSTWISSMDVYSAGGTPTTGAQVVYKLATPQTYQLTPTEVEMLLGQNNIWADTGDVQSVQYQADTKRYIDKKIAELA